MVTVQIRWEGTEETMNDRLNHVKELITDLGCKPTSPVETNDMYYLCGSVIINLTSGIGDLDVWVQGVDKNVFNFVTPIVDMIYTTISKYIEDGKWGSDSYETRVSLELYEAETTCRCEA
jgi:hypothetical protein